MKTLLYTTLSLLFFCSIQALALEVRASLPYPADDPFYSPPDGWKDKPLGTILRKRKVEINSFFGLNLQEAWQLLYRTSYVTKDQPTTSVTTIMVPYNAKRNRLLVSGEFEDANGPQCAPSYTYRAGVQSDPSATVNMAATIPYLKEGYIVTVPDKESRKGAFASGHVEGHQTLDATRATLAFDHLNLTKDIRIAGQGYSGGAIQTGWAASLKPTYAPELPFVGWYAGGPPTNLTSLILSINKGIFSAFLLGGVAGLSDTYPEMNDYIEEVATQEMKDALDYIRTHCLVDDLLKYPFQDIFDYKWTTKGPDVLDDPRIQKVLSDLTMGVKEEQTPDAPVLIVSGKVDEISPNESAEKTARSWCNYGGSVEFVDYDTDLSAHFITQVTATTRAFKWVRDRLEGKPLPKRCIFTKSYDVILDVEELGDQYVDILKMIDGFAGDKIGPGDKILISKLKKGQQRDHKRRYYKAL